MSACGTVFQNRLGLARWHVPWAFMGSNPDNRAQSEVNERFALSQQSKSIHGASEALAVDQRCLRILFPVPMDIGGDELQPSYASILIHVEDDTRWFIAKEILSVGLWK